MSSSRDVEGETALADMVVSGRQFYEAQQYKRALEQFTRNFERVAAEEGCIFKEAMYNCKCDVGRTFNKCDNRNHIQALDYRAATFEALGKLDRAKKDAEWILELAPRLPDGYLRLGKVARLQKNHEFAWKIYNAGISINKDVEVASSPKLQVHSDKPELADDRLD
ncbi:Protein DIA2 [Metarhizium anisopliae]|nr:Protein DIA2 [Metarhizium anisopliae]